jgi:hypothetical protein
VPKPNPRLQSAAASCQKIEAFAVDHDRGGKCSQTQAATGAGGKRLQRGHAANDDGGEEEEEYDLEWHAANFDPWKHGDFQKGGAMWFRRPDGKIIPSFEGVKKFTKSGHFVPG